MQRQPPTGFMPSTFMPGAPSTGAPPPSSASAAPPPTQATRASQIAPPPTSGFGAAQPPPPVAPVQAHAQPPPTAAAAAPAAPAHVQAAAAQTQQQHAQQHQQQTTHHQQQPQQVKERERDMCMWMWMMMMMMMMMRVSLDDMTTADVEDLHQRMRAARDNQLRIVTKRGAIRHVLEARDRVLQLVRACVVEQHARRRRHGIHVAARRKLHRRRRAGLLVHGHNAELGPELRLGRRLQRIRRFRQHLRRCKVRH
jgi:hypothetical protein